MKLGMCIGTNVYNTHTQHLSRYLEGQGHSMTMKQNRVRPIIGSRIVAHNIWVATLKVKVTA